MDFSKQVQLCKEDKINILFFCVYTASQLEEMPIINTALPKKNAKF